MNSLMSLSNKVAIVTGGASGIGAGIAQTFIDNGCIVVITDIDKEAGKAKAQQLGDNGSFIHQDVTSECGWQDVIEQVVNANGQLDILVNNAGIGAAQSIEQTDLDSWNVINSVNATGVFLGCKYAIDEMKDNNGGVITNVSSVLGVRPLRNTPAYGASKAAVVNLTKSTALHCAQQGYGIRCNAITPGFIRTPLLLDSLQASEDSEAMLNEYNKLHPMGHIGEVEDVANVALFLCSEQAKFITGIAMPVDGGFTI